MYNGTEPYAMAFTSEGPLLLGWNLEADDLSLLHPHWQTFEAPPLHYHLVLGVIYFVLMISSIFGNGVVVWIFTT